MWKNFPALEMISFQNCCPSNNEFKSDPPSFSSTSMFIIGLTGMGFEGKTLPPTWYNISDTSIIPGQLYLSDNRFGGGLPAEWSNAKWGYIQFEYMPNLEG